MAYNTTISQGTFVSTNAAVQIIQLPSGVDWMNVYNYTQSNAPANGVGVEFYWQSGLAANDGFVTYYTGAAPAIARNTSNNLGVGGFTYINSSIIVPGPNIAITNINGAGLVLTGNTTGLSIGSLVRFNNVVNALQICGPTWTVTAVNPGVSFTITPPVPFAAPGATTGNYQLIPFDPIYYPRNRTITNITAANPGLVTTSANHGLTVGQLVRLEIPTVTAISYGMTALNGLTFSIATVPALNTFTIAYNTVGLTAFAFPLTNNVPFTFAQVVPVGEETDTGNVYNPIFNPNTLDDATINTAFIGMSLAAGITSPAGRAADLIYWVAGKSFNI